MSENISITKKPKITRKRRKLEKEERQKNGISWNFPSDVIYILFSVLSIPTLCKLPTVCKHFNEVINNNSYLWRKKYFELFEGKEPQNIEQRTDVKFLRSSCIRKYNLLMILKRMLEDPNKFDTSLLIASLPFASLRTKWEFVFRRMIKLYEPLKKTTKSIAHMILPYVAKGLETLNRKNQCSTDWENVKYWTDALLLLLSETESLRYSKWNVFKRNGLVNLISIKYHFNQIWSSERDHREAIISIYYTLTRDYNIDVILSKKWFKSQYFKEIPPFELIISENATTEKRLNERPIPNIADRWTYRINERTLAPITDSM